MRQGQNNSKRSRGRGRKPQHSTNRAYDSNGPDVKIRGTATHVCEKYQQLARDAISAGDRVMAENYYQHAEHYYRLLMAAQVGQEGQVRPQNSLGYRPPEDEEEESDFTLDQQQPQPRHPGQPFHQQNGQGHQGGQNNNGSRYDRNDDEDGDDDNDNDGGQDAQPDMRQQEVRSSEPRTSEGRQPNAEGEQPRRRQNRRRRPRSDAAGEPRQGGDQPRDDAPRAEAPAPADSSAD